MPKISALIHTNHNDAHRLGRTLESLRCCDEILVVDHSPGKDTEKIAHQYGATFKQSIVGVDDGAYAFDCRHDWIFCLLPSETVSEALEATVLEWKHSEPEKIAGYAISIREQRQEGWRQLGREMRLANRTCVNWTDRIPPTVSNTGELSGDLLRFLD